MSCGSGDEHGPARAHGGEHAGRVGGLDAEDHALGRGERAHRRGGERADADLDRHERRGAPPSAAELLGSSAKIVA